MRFLRFLLLVCGGAVALHAVPALGIVRAAGQAPDTAQGSGRAGAQLAILDTDIGDDIDDAYALALALRSPELKLLGITTAYGDTDLRAKLVDRFLVSVCAGDLPVIPGAPSSQSNVFTQSAYAHGTASAVCDHPHAANPQQQRHWDELSKRHDAAGFLLEQIKAHSGQITLIAIGPLNNVEAAIKRDPATFAKLKRVVMMGGSIDRGYDDAKGRRPPDAEWNISRDPAGLRALLASGVPVFMMPLDSTQIHLENPEREQIFAHGSPLTDQLTLLYHQWKAGSDGHPDAPTLFDPVAVTYAIRPDLCPATPIRIEVDDKGFTRPVEGTPNAQVCLKSDEKGFLDLLLGRLTQEAGQ